MENTDVRLAISFILYCKLIFETTGSRQSGSGEGERETVGEQSSFRRQPTWKWVLILHLLERSPRNSSAKHCLLLLL